jgi:hypothetical protein
MVGFARATGLITRILSSGKTFSSALIVTGLKAVASLITSFAASRQEKENIFFKGSGHHQWFVILGPATNIMV